MQIIVTPNNIDNLDELLDYSDCFLIGLENFNMYMTVSAKIDKIKEITDKLHSLNKKIFVNINKIFHNNELDALKEVITKLDTFGVDFILFDDYAVLSLSRSITCPSLVWANSHFVTNYKSINVYNEKGVKCAFISPDITLDEIKEIKQNSKSELIVEVCGYPHMFSSKRRLINSYFDYTNKSNNKNNYVIKEEASGFSSIVYENENGTHMRSNHLLFDLESSIKLKNMDIDYLYFDFEFISNEDSINILKAFINEDEALLTNIDSNDGFFNRKTIYKVKK